MSRNNCASQSQVSALPTLRPLDKELLVRRFKTSVCFFWNRRDSTWILKRTRSSQSGTAPIFRAFQASMAPINTSPRLLPAFAEAFRLGFPIGPGLVPYCIGLHDRAHVFEPFKRKLDLLGHIHLKATDIQHMIHMIQCHMVALTNCTNKTRNMRVGTMRINVSLWSSFLTNIATITTSNQVRATSTQIKTDVTSLCHLCHVMSHGIMSLFCRTPCPP